MLPVCFLPIYRRSLIDSLMVLTAIFGLPARPTARQERRGWMGERIGRGRWRNGTRTGAIQRTLVSRRKTHKVERRTHKVTSKTFFLC